MARLQLLSFSWRMAPNLDRKLTEAVDILQEAAHKSELQRQPSSALSLSYIAHRVCSICYEVRTGLGATLRASSERDEPSLLLQALSLTAPCAI